MAKPEPRPLRDLDEDLALRTILEGTATETGAPFFSALVQNLAMALNTYGAWVTEYLEQPHRLRALAFWMGGQWIQGYEMDIVGTPCHDVIRTARLVHIPDNVLTLYPDANEGRVRAIGAVSYLGAPLLDLDGKILGHLAVMDTQPLQEAPRIYTLFRIFAARAATELQRLRAETEVREREEKLGRLIDSAMDAIIELDQNLCITRINVAGEKVFECKAADIIGYEVSRFLAPESCQKFTGLLQLLDTRPQGQQYLWIPGGLTVLRANGPSFPAEATLSRFEMRGKPYYTLILRNVNERLEAERRIQSLTVETEYLKEELQALHGLHELIGKSAALRAVLCDVQQVAPTDTTILILGETGTGKELIARALHAASRRREKALIKVNCAALPATLIESELFGHEKGAFTGATKKRDGRFTLADGGTIFLDEIGELSLDLQAKLLRVLQENEFEAVGSSHTHKVDVRVLTATNRDLYNAVQEGKFREDLYYRLNVFPICVPPLRERGDDVILLASAFAERFAQRMGRHLEPLTEDCMRRLRAYNWPGNVRELQNVIERAVITARDGRLNLDRALPEAARNTPIEAVAPGEAAKEGVWTIQQLEDLERRNIVRALQSTGWRVAGDHGAARLLGINASTLSSKMRVLGIKRSG